MKKIIEILQKILKFLFARDETASVRKVKECHYKHKDFIMTYAEADFFRLLLEAVGDDYHVYPQVHLSAIIDHKVEGQNWKAAFSHINGKSVDFVICDKKNFRPLAGVELDDRTHEAKSRQLRDAEVERIFIEAGLNLIRVPSTDAKNPATLKHLVREGIGSQ